MRSCACAAAILLACSASPARRAAEVSPATTGRVALHVDTGEADAVLAMIGAVDQEAAWRRLTTTAGFVRLAARERSLKREFDTEQFRAFVGSPALAARAPALRDTLARWRAIRLDAIASRVFAYLPAEAKLVATIYPVIKPRNNSFVFFDDAGAAIFAFVDPAVTAAQHDNTIAHELHHIGFASLEHPPCTAAPATCSAREWASAFGEGFAMLAAAGGPDVHPHHASTPADRARWDRDVARFDDDLRRVEALLLDVVAGTLDAERARERAMAFFGVQGPWYTIGWSMAVAIERCAGRAVLVEAMRKPWTTLGLYNEVRGRCPARGTATALWNPDLVRALN